MTKTRSKNECIRAPISNTQKQAIDEYCEQKNTTIAKLIRESVLRKIGRKDLINEIQMGRPPEKVEP